MIIYISHMSIFSFKQWIVIVEGNKEDALYLLGNDANKYEKIRETLKKHPRQEQEQTLCLPCLFLQQ
jgi:hypothetical protein